MAAFNEILFAVAGSAYAVLLILLLWSPGGGITRAILAATCATTAASAGLIALEWAAALRPSGAIAELLRTGPWCVFLLHLLNKQRAGEVRFFIVMSGCGILLALLVLTFGFLLQGTRVTDQYMLVGAFATRLGFAVFGLLLTENLYRNTAPDLRWHVNLLCIGVGGIFAYSVILYADALLFRRVSPLLWSGQAVAMTIAAPLVAVTAARNRNWRVEIHVARRIVFHTAALVISGIFLLALALAGEIFRKMSPGWGDLAEMSLLITGVVIIGMLVTSGSARSYARSKLVDNFYSHRYDYREEWLKSIRVLSARDDISVQTRVIRAVAGVTDSPAGVLWIRDLGGTAFQWEGSWNHPPVPIAQAADDDFISQFQQGEWVIELDRVVARPRWLVQMPRAWLAVPLAQNVEILGFVVLMRPRAPFKLDRETFDLLCIIASHCAVHIAERRNAQALADVRQLGDYGKRFAFAVHDMKNVVGQLGLILRNADAHRNNPDFQCDVMITVKSAFERMQKLIIRLREPLSSRSEQTIVPATIIRDEVAIISRSRGSRIDIEDNACTAAVAMDEAAFRSVITHLCENAVEAAHECVRLWVRQSRSGIEIDIADDGPGMDPEFVRDKLFRPLESRKRDGLGIGAYQARELLRAAGGDLLVMSRPNGGTTMRVVLPVAAELAERGI